MKRFVLQSDIPLENLDDFFSFGLENSADTVIVSLSGEDRKPAAKRSRRMEAIFAKAAHYHVTIEMGGWELSRLVPKKYFLFHKDLFRMEQGKRIKHVHFCPTNPETIRVIQKEARNMFRNFPEIQTFHLWPEKNCEQVWCNCPSCRAFSFAEQNIIAVNAAADVLAEINPEAKLSYIEIETNNDETPKIKPRENMFVLLLDDVIQETNSAVLERKL